MPLLSQLDLPSATIIAAMVGGTSVAVINFIANFIAKHYESKPQYRELAIKAAPDNWRHHNELKTDLIKAGASGGGLSIDGPDGYIIHMLRIMDIAADTRISSQDAARRIRKLNVQDTPVPNK